MAQTVLLTLTTAGADTGPFDLYSNEDGFLIPFETGIAKLDLEAGYISYLVPDSAITIRIQSTNVLCTNYVDLTIGVITTTTTTSSTSSTTTTTTTVNPALYDYYLADQYVCGTCTLNITNMVVRVSTGTPITIGWYYGSTDGFTYFVKSVTTTATASEIFAPGDPDCGTVSCF